MSSLRVFYGHHKCATGWITENIREMIFHLGQRHKIVHLPKHFAAYGTLDGLVAATRADMLFYTNATMEQARTLRPHRGFHVVRDPRDVLVSAYFSHLHSHPTDDWSVLATHRQRLQAVSKEEGLVAEMDFSRPQFESMMAWDYDQPHVLEMQMETLTADPLAGFTRVARFFGWLDDEAALGRGLTGLLRVGQLRLNRLNHRGRRFMPGSWPMFPVPKRRLETMPPRELARIVEDKSFRRLSGGRSKGQENVQSHYRKGVPGDWKNHFSAEHRRLFKRRHGDLLIRLGYEADHHW
jgi:hypothetical protein